MDRPSLGTLLRNNLLAVLVALVAVVVIAGSVVLDASNARSDVPASQSADRLVGKDHPKDKDSSKAEKRRDKADERHGPKAPHAGDLGKLFLGQLPQDLRQDLRDLRKADPEERLALGHTMFEKALAGGYGDRVKKQAEMLEELVNG